jgi:hypothetical protein
VCASVLRTLVRFKEEATSKILAAGDVAAICPKAQFTDSRLRVLQGTPARPTEPSRSNILLFVDNSSKMRRHSTSERK